MAKKSFKLTALLREIEDVLERELALAAGFDHPSDLKSALLKSLGEHDGFHQALRETHAVIRGQAPRQQPKPISQPRKARTGGRHAAARHEGGQPKGRKRA